MIQFSVLGPLIPLGLDSEGAASIYSMVIHIASWSKLRHYIQLCPDVLTSRGPCCATAPASGLGMNKHCISQGRWKLYSQRERM